MSELRKFSFSNPGGGGGGGGGGGRSDLLWCTKLAHYDEKRVVSKHLWSLKIQKYMVNMVRIRFYKMEVKK